jgi:perosamine synthetase
MHGQTYNGKLCGSFGDVSIFSFYPNKHITTGEGGMIVCNDDHLAERCRKLRNLAFEPGRRFVHKELGWNYRMTNLQAALGLAQLERLDAHLDKKRHIGKLYQEGLKGLPGFQLPLASTDYAENIYWVFGLVADTQELCERMVDKLGKVGIGTRPFFWCMHEQPVFLDMGFFKGESYPSAEKMARNGFYIPSGLGLSDQEIYSVIEKIKAVL